MTRRSWILAVAGGTVSATSGVVTRGSDLSSTARLLVLGAALAVVVASDLSERRIPNKIVLPATGLCLLLDAAGRTHWRALMAAFAITAILFLLAIVETRAVGMGDVKLAALIAVGLPISGGRALVSGLMFACMFGLAVAAAQRRPLNEIALPLAPFFALGAVVALI